MRSGERRTRRTKGQYEAIFARIVRDLDSSAVLQIRRGTKVTLDDFHELGIPVEKGLAVRRLQLEIRSNSIHYGFATA